MLKIESLGDAQLVTIGFDAIDATNSEEVKSYVKKIVEGTKESQTLVVDLSNVLYMDSSGLGSMVGLLRLCSSENHALVLSGMNPKVESLFSLTRMDKIFTIVADIKSLKKNSKISPEEMPAWQALQIHYLDVKDVHMRDMFLADPERHNKMSLHVEDILLDYSKNRITDKTLELLVKLAEETEVESWRDKMFKGESINTTENRAVLHTALRNRSDRKILVDGEDVMPRIKGVLQHMRDFSDSVRNGEWLGYTGKPITDIINIGIGGSDLGPKMVTEALRAFHHERLNTHFISNVDGAQFLEVAKKLNPETCLFIVVSKTFSTQETMTNAKTARDWFIEKSGDSKHVDKHFVAVSVNTELVTAFGIHPDNMFPIWDWVGGRYSVWSAVSLVVAVVAGMDAFEEFLEGAHMMDEHFLNAPLASNMPVILALIGTWYNNFFHCESYAVLPYDHQLSYFPSYFEQMDMESNGKSIGRDGGEVGYTTGPIVWGEQGINGQHAFYQLIHQGTKLIPADFIASVLPVQEVGSHHDIMMSNFFAQTEALYQGRTAKETKKLLEASGVKNDEVDSLLPHMVFEGNNPTNSLLFRKLKPRALGALIALYEHKVFVQGIIWQINSFDQWGVELGKQLAKKVLMELENDAMVASHDSSTNNLINYYKLLRQTN